MKTNIMKRLLCMFFALIMLTGIYISFGTATASAAAATPAQVKSLKATPSTTSIKLTWKKVSGTVNYAVFSYSPSTKKYTVLANVSATSYTVKNLKSGYTYYYAVQAYTTSNGKRTYGKVSSSVKTTTKVTAPAQVKNVKASSISTTSVKLTWTKISSAKYAIYSYNSKTKEYTHLGNSATNSYTVKNLKSGTAYRFAVKAYKTVNSKKYYGKVSTSLKVTTKLPALTKAQARKQYNKAIDVYMNWIYSCNYTSSSNTISSEFYGMTCQFAPVVHSTVKTKADLIKLLDQYFDESVYENELYLYIEQNGKLYYYAEGGKSDPDTGTKHYTDKLTKINNDEYLYILYPTYYPNHEDRTSPDEYVFTVVRIKNNKWIFTDVFYPCYAEIKT